MGFPGSVAHDDDFQVENTKLATTDATATILWSKAIPAGGVIRARVTTVAVKSDGTEHAAFDRVLTARRNGTGNVALVGSVVVPVPDAKTDGTWGGVSTTDSDFTDTGTQAAKVLATGKAATTITWRTRVTILQG